MTARAAGAGLLAAVWLLAGAAPALADPAGPTDYRTEVVAVEPPVEGLRIEVIGGDSFVLVEAGPALTVEVVGYRGEPYLRFLPGGVVQENRLSPTTYLNLDRYGIADLPPDADPGAEPEWRVVARDGSYAWHDHRAHWMNRARPPGREPGDVILEGVIPLVVDGVEVDVAVRSVWLPAPSLAPVVGGMAAGLTLAAIAALLRAGPGVLSALLAVVAGAAAAAGLTAYLSVPPETGPSWALWAPPVSAAVLAALAAAGRWWAPLRRRRAALAAVAAVVVVAWGFLHREWMWRAVLPTAAPAWLGRAVTGAAVTAGIGLLMLAGRAQAAGADGGDRPAEYA